MNKQTKTLCASTIAAALSFPLPAMAADSHETGAAAVGEIASAGKAHAVDAFIAGRLMTAFALSPHLNPFEIGVDVNDRVVKLSGTVHDKVERDLAIEIAKGMDEVTVVESAITIDESKKSTVKTAKRDFARSFEDATTTARVKSRLLWNGSTTGTRIDVDTVDQVVILSGQVDSAAEAALAEQIALNTRGVVEVTNLLRVSPTS